MSNKSKISLSIVLFLSVLAVLLFLTGCQPSLPDDARKELDRQVRARDPNLNYTIVSAKKATDPYTGYDEGWCVVIDPPVSTLGGGVSHFLLMRKALLWTGELCFGTERSFLARGCDNW